MHNWLVRIWYRGHWLADALVPLSLLFRVAVTARRALYARGVLASRRLALPVVVVGNLAVGGTGKTPLVMWLAHGLRRKGFSPGIVCRGYRGRSRHWPQRVSADSDPYLVGDEAVLLAETTGCPVVADPDRVRAARRLIAEGRCDVIISDDGLQHYRLARDMEIAVVDGERRYGNGHCLPAGPLREPLSRLSGVDAVVSNGPPGGDEWAMRLVPGPARCVADPSVVKPLAAFIGQPLAAVCAIGHPERFFAMLRRAGLAPTERSYPDHHAFVREDLRFAGDPALLMTDKDAVKCRRLGAQNAWSVSVKPCVDQGLIELVMRRLGRAGAPPAPGGP